MALVCRAIKRMLDYSQKLLAGEGGTSNDSILGH